MIDRHAAMLAIGACGVLILIGVLVIRVIGGFDGVPGWWKKIDAVHTDRAVLVDQGERLENAITTQLTALRDPQDSQWATAMDSDQINAWLETRLVQTIQTHQGNDAWPDEVGRVRVEILNNQLVIGIRAAHTSGSLILWAYANLELDDQGDLWMTVSHAHIGTTRVPMRVLNRFSNERFNQSRYHIGRGSLDLGDGRNAQLLALRVNGGRIELVMDTRVSVD